MESLVFAGNEGAGMSTDRFCGNHEHDPRSLWREIVVGADCTIDEFQSVSNRTVFSVAGAVTTDSLF